DTFEAFEKFTIHHLCRAYHKGMTARELEDLIKNRKRSFWYNQHQHGYEAIRNAIEFRELLGKVDLTIDSISTGINRYLSTWYRIDTAFRRSTYHFRAYGQVNLMEQAREWVEKSYVNNFLLPLADRWGDQIRKLSTWDSHD